MIKFYPSRLEGEPLWVFETDEPLTLGEWVAANRPEFAGEDPPLSFHINGMQAGVGDTFGPDDAVEIHVEPRGIGAIIAGVVAAVVAVAVVMLMPTPAAPRSQQQARQLGTATLSANTPRLGEPIPEIAGRPPRVYPDFLVPTRVYYEDKGTRYAGDPVQWVEVLLCVGKGFYQKSLSEVFVGGTQGVALGDDAVLKFYEPGESVAGETAAQYWHTPREVGFTSRGNAGMELKAASDIAASTSANSFSVSGDVLQIPAADPAVFPTSWEPGTILRVEVPFLATVVPGNPRDSIISQFGFAHFTPTVGQLVELTGPDDGLYRIASYTAPGAAVPGNPGEPSILTGDAPPARLDFGDDPASLTITAGGRAYVVALTSNYGSETELVSVMLGQLNAAGVSVTLVSGTVRLTEVSPFSGTPISVSGDAAADVFGENPVSVVGVQTTPAVPESFASVTFNDENGVPVRGLTAGTHNIAVGPEGLAFRVEAVTNSKSLEMEPVGWPTWNGWPELVSPNIQVNLGVGNRPPGWTGPFAAVEPGETCIAVELDFVFPGGIRYTKSSGSIRERTAQIVVSWREIGTSQWTEQVFSFTDGTADPRAYTVRLNTPVGSAPEIRVRHGNPSTHYKTINDCQWTGLRGRMVAPDSYAGVTTLAVKLRTGDRISSQADNRIWCRVTRMLEPVEGGPLQPTRDIAPFFLHMLSSVGYGRNRVDMPTLSALHAIWSSRGDTFDYEVKDSTTVKTLGNHVLKAGFAEMTVDRGLVKPVRDAARARPQYVYSPQEFTEWPTMTTTLPKFDEVDGVDAEYLDETTGRSATVKFRLSGDVGRRAQKISLIGITDPVKAWRQAARHRRILAFRRTAFKGTTRNQALNSSYMSYDVVQDSIPGYGQSAFLVGYSAAGGQLTVQLSEHLDWARYPAPVLALRRLDGRVVGPFPATRVGSDDVAKIEDPGIELNLGGDGRDPTMAYFGSVDNWAHEVLVTRITPRADGTATIEGVEYAEQVYADDDGAPA